MWNTVPTFVYLNIALLPLDSCLSLNPAPSSATSELPLQYDLISVVAFGFTLWATVSLTYIIGCRIKWSGIHLDKFMNIWDNYDINKYNGHQSPKIAVASK